MSDDLVTPLRNAAYLAFEDGTNDYTTPALAAARIAKLEAALHKIADRTKRAHPQAQEGEIHQIAITALTKTQENINDINE